MLVHCVYQGMGGKGETQSPWLASVGGTHHISLNALRHLSAAAFGTGSVIA